MCLCLYRADLDVEASRQSVKTRYRLPIVWANADKLNLIAAYDVPNTSNTSPGTPSQKGFRVMVNVGSSA